MKRYISLCLTALLGVLFTHAESISVPNVSIEPGQTGTVGISLTNEHTDLVSFQMDLTLPDGVSINKAGCSLTSRFTDEDQELTIGKQGNNVYRLTSTSFALTPISGTSGDIITLSLTAAADSEGGMATLSNIRFVTSNSERVAIDDVNFSITVIPDKEEQTLALESLPAMIYGDEAYTLPETTEQGLTLTWTSDNSAVATISGHVLTAVGAGTATITATQEGNNNYLPFSREYTLTVLGFEEVTFDFTTAEGLEAMGVAASDIPTVEASANAGVSFNTTGPFIKNGVTISITDGSTPSRIWSPKGNDGTNYQYRVYGTGTVTFIAPSGKTITSIVLTTGTWNEPTPSSGAFDGKTWTGNAHSLTFTHSGQCQYKTVVITLGDSDGFTVNSISELTDEMIDNKVTLVLDNAEVVHIWTSDSGNTQAFVRDNTGACQFYNIGFDLNKGDVLNGTITATYTLHNNNPEMTTPVTENNLSVSSGSTVPRPKLITISSAAQNRCDMVTLSNVSLIQQSASYYVVDANDNQLMIYNGFFDTRFNDLSEYIDQNNNTTITGIIIMQNDGTPTLYITELGSSALITFADANVKALCVQNWDTNGDGELSEAEAAAVTDLGTVFSGIGITSFDELQYFTGVTSIGEYAFGGCGSLTSVIIPSSVTSIGVEAFFDSGLTSIEVEAGNSAYSSEDGVLFNKDKTTILRYPAGKTSSTYSIPNSVTTIGDGAFESCSGLTSVTIPNSVITIGDGAFTDCTGLTSLTIPSSVTSVGVDVFWCCSGLTSVMVTTATPLSIGVGTFYIEEETFTNATLYVPAGSKAAYEAANGWKNFKKIVEYNMIWSGEQVIKDWNCLFIEKERLSDLKVGDLLHVKIKDVTEGATTDNWKVFCDFRDGDWTQLEEWQVLAENTTEVTFLLTGDNLQFIKAKGMLFTAGGYTITDIYTTETSYTGSDNSIWVGNQADAVYISVHHLKNANGKTGLAVGDIIRLTYTGSDGDFGLHFFGEDTNWQWQDVGEIVKERTATGADVRVTQAMVDMLNNNLSNFVVSLNNITLTQVELTKDWFNIAVNSDLEGTDNVCFLSRENCLEDGTIIPATIVEGAGTDGSRGIVVQSIDNPTHDWDTQFFVRLPQTLPTGTNYHISFDYKASQEASGGTGMHAEPGQWNWYGIGTINYTTEWQHFEYYGTVSEEQSPADNPMRTFVFSLAEIQTATTYYFDNVVFEIDKNQVTPLAIVAEAPTAKELTYTGSAQELVNAGSALFGTMQYSLDGTTYSTDIPTGTDARDYILYYKVVGDADHGDTEPETVTVTIAESEPEIEVTDISQIDNVVYIENTDAFVGNQVTLSVKMKNAMAIQTIQFDFYLPEGTTVVANDDDELITPSKARIKKFNYFESAIQSDGALRLLAQATTTNIAAGDGEICTITLNIPDDMAEGEYPLTIKNIHMVEMDDTSHSPNPNLVLSKLIVNSYIPGDANSDGAVNAIDFNMIGNHILGYEQHGINLKAADINGDGDINAIDFNMVGNIILNGNGAAAKMAEPDEVEEPA